MKACIQCEEKENDDDERFCRTCGADMDGVDLLTISKTTELGVMRQDENTLIICDKSPGRLMLGNKILTIIDSSQRLIGRADLKDHTDDDPDLISRSHFTVYREDLKYMIKDGVTAVQDKPSEHGTMLNGEYLDGEREIKNGDRITVSDIEIVFEA